MSKEHAIRGLNHVAMTKSSISGASLSNFSTFLPWEDNFNSRCSWKKKLNHFNDNNKYFFFQTIAR